MEQCDDQSLWSTSRSNLGNVKKLYWRETSVCQQSCLSHEFQCVGLKGYDKWNSMHISRHGYRHSCERNGRPCYSVKPPTFVQTHFRGFGSHKRTPTRRVRSCHSHFRLQPQIELSPPMYGTNRKTEVLWKVRTDYKCMQLTISGMQSYLTRTRKIASMFPTQGHHTLPSASPSWAAVIQIEAATDENSCH